MSLPVCVRNTNKNIIEGLDNSSTGEHYKTVLISQLSVTHLGLGRGSSYLRRDSQTSLSSSRET